VEHFGDEFFWSDENGFDIVLCSLSTQEENKRVGDLITISDCGCPLHHRQGDRGLAPILANSLVEEGRSRRLIQSIHNNVRIVPVYQIW